MLSVSRRLVPTGVAGMKSWPSSSPSVITNRLVADVHIAGSWYSLDVSRRYFASDNGAPTEEKGANGLRVSSVGSRQKLADNLEETISDSLAKNPFGKGRGSDEHDDLFADRLPLKSRAPLPSPPPLAPPPPFSSGGSSAWSSFVSGAGGAALSRKTGVRGGWSTEMPRGGGLFNGSREGAGRGGRGADIGQALGRGDSSSGGLRHQGRGRGGSMTQNAGGSPQGWTHPALASSSSSSPKFSPQPRPVPPLPQRGTLPLPSQVLAAQRRAPQSEQRQQQTKKKKKQQQNKQQQQQQQQQQHRPHAGQGMHGDQRRRRGTDHRKQFGNRGDGGHGSGWAHVAGGGGDGQRTELESADVPPPVAPALDVNPFARAKSQYKPWSSRRASKLATGEDDDDDVDLFRESNPSSRRMGGGGGSSWEQSRRSRKEQEQEAKEMARKQRAATAAAKAEERKKAEEAAKQVVLGSGTMSVHALARRLGLKKADLAKKFKTVLGMEDVDTREVGADEVDLDDVELLLLELGYTVTRSTSSSSSSAAGSRRRQAALLEGIEEGEQALEGIENEAQREAQRLTWPKRAPVISVMGHVDAGKTTLLDALRNDAMSALNNQDSASSSNEAGGEAGGITQRVAAFLVPTAASSSSNSTATAAATEESEEGGVTAAAAVTRGEEEDDSPGFMTVIDTPGHAAFAAMRQSGVAATDVIVCVIAAESGVQPQTEEVLELARSTGCALVVAVTKLDRMGEGAERNKAMDQISTQLLEKGWVTEEFGGDVPVVGVSGKTGEGLQDLKEQVELQAEMLDLRAQDGNSETTSGEEPPSRVRAEGVVLECALEKGHGPVVDMLVSSGRIKVGDNVVVGQHFGKVRRLLGSPTPRQQLDQEPETAPRHGKKGSGIGNSSAPAPATAAARVQNLESAGPSQAVKVVGLKGLPVPGQRIAVVRDEARAKQLASLRENQAVHKRLMETKEAVNSAALHISHRTGQLSRFALRKQRIQERRLRLATAAGGASPAEVEEVVARANAERVQAAERAAKELEEGRLSGPVPFPVVVKVDTLGSVAALTDLIAALPDDKVQVQLVHIEVGPVTLGDLELAMSAGKEVMSTANNLASETVAPEVAALAGHAPVFAFNVNNNTGEVTTAAKKGKVSIRKHRVIYSLVDDLRALLSASIPALTEERIQGRALVKEMFQITRKGQGKLNVAGCEVSEGRMVTKPDLVSVASSSLEHGSGGAAELVGVSPQASFRVIRKGEIVHIHHGDISLQHFQEEVPEVKFGTECGIGFGTFAGIEAGDQIECFVTVSVKQEL